MSQIKDKLKDVKDKVLGAGEEAKDTVVHQRLAANTSKMLLDQTNK
jgi:hypothetical protein